MTRWVLLGAAVLAVSGCNTAEAAGDAVERAVNKAKK